MKRRVDPMARNQLPTDEAQPVGYCSPPPEYRWPPGYCPNQAGRPRKRKIDMKVPRILSEFEQRLLAEARKVVGRINGEDVTNVDRVWLKLKAKTDDPRYAKMVLQHYLEVMAADTAVRQNAVQDLLAYIAYWGPIFENARGMRRPLPRVLPDPMDIVIDSPTSFRFIGPVTAQEALDWKFFRQAREAFFMVAREIVEVSGHSFPVEEGKARWDKIRRQFYRVNRRLPVIFKKKHPARFPPFTPTIDPPDWYEEDDY